MKISKTDAYQFETNPPVRISGDLRNSVGLMVIGPKGRINLKRSVIIAARHIHMTDKEAIELGIKNGDEVSVEIDGKRALVFNNVIIRTGKDYRFRMHLDTDEANAADLGPNSNGFLLT